MEKTHWRKVVSDPNFIGEADFQEGEEKVLTIGRVNQSETVQTAEGKSKKAVVHWKEPGNKPMILNVARSKSIEKVAGSGYFEDWPGVQVQLYIEHGIKAFGEVVSAVRVRPYKPRAQAKRAASKCSGCGKEITPAMGKPADWVEAYTVRNYGVALCAECAARRKSDRQAAATEAHPEDTGAVEAVNVADGTETNAIQEGLPNDSDK